MTVSLSSIRREFLDYFKELGHKECQSSRLVPENDPTLLFTNAGMVQFKDVFTGKKVMPFKRATTSQKCVRAGGKHNDLENVGYTARHHTFFEMLGNFSFGDYFKSEVIPFAWTLVTERLGLPPEKLLVTVHSSDEEAAGIWKKVTGFSDDKIIRIPTSANFWSMGNTGPCGPCSEIFYDHGAEISGGKPGSKDEDGDRFIEIWNLVFMQFETLQSGERVNLPKPSIDTGMGLERITAVLQGVHNNFDIDLFQKIINDIVNITNIEYKGNEAHNNVIADHIRAITFMIADGIIPSNEGRGYVLRRIIRRALRHGHALNMHEPFLFKLVNSVVETMGDHYTDLQQKASHISTILKSEETGFMNTIDNGMALLKKELNKLGSSNEFPAEIAFKLYDTFGFPFDLTQDVLRAENKRIDAEKFDKCVKAQKERSKTAWVGTGDQFTDKVWFDISEQITKNKLSSNHIYKFLTRDNSADTTVHYIIKNGNIVNTTTIGDEVLLVLGDSTFYPKSGGAVGDNGTLTWDNGKAIVVDTYKKVGLIVHQCVISEGTLSKNDIVSMHVDYERRLSISRNHTATHLLQSALRQLFGDNIFQQGSLVMPEKLRFDFHCEKSIDKKDIKTIETILQEWIDDGLPVKNELMSKDEAIKNGAIALFNEKYPDTVRVINIGNGVSIELCGGEHVLNTSYVGAFKITSISSTGTNTLRIEAVTGCYVKKYLEEILTEQQEFSEKNSQIIRELNKQIEQLKSKLFIENIKPTTKTINGINIQSLLLDKSDQKSILALIDKTKSAQSETCLIIGNKTKNDIIVLYVTVSSILQHKLTACDIVKHVALTLNLNIKQFDRKDMVQIGGIASDKFDDIVLCIEKLINQK